MVRLLSSKLLPVNFETGFVKECKNIQGRPHDYGDSGLEMILRGIEARFGT